MTALRERMTEDLILRGLSLNTQAAYLRAVSQLARYYRRSPERISEREVAAYLLHLYREKGRSHSTCNQAVAALRFFYSVTLRRRVASFVIPAARQPLKLPHILSREELVRLFSQTRLLRHRALLLTVYATGLRVSEVVALRVCDIDSDRRVLPPGKAKAPATAPRRAPCISRSRCTGPPAISRRCWTSSRSDAACAPRRSLRLRQDTRPRPTWERSSAGTGRATAPPTR